MTTRRENVLSWDEYFMSLALLSSQRSKGKDSISKYYLIYTDKYYLIYMDSGVQAFARS